jgi:hypothetical protein
MIKTIIKVSLLIFWIGSGLSFLSQQDIGFSKATLTAPDGKKQEINLPYAMPSTQSGNYVFNIKFEKTALPTKAFLIWIDDCLEDISLNNIALPHIGRRCLDPNGVIVDFSNAYINGENNLQIKVKENGGKLKLSFQSYSHNNILMLLNIIFIFGIAILWLSISKNFKHRAVINLTLLAVVFRVVFIFILHPAESYLFSDMAGHEKRALDIINGYANAQNIEKPPGYHFLVALSLSFFKNLEAIKLMQLVASVLTCFVVAEASKHLFGKRGYKPMFAIMAVHIPLIFIAGILMEECLFALTMAWLFLLLLKKSSYLKMGLVFGLAFCLKGTHVFFPPLAALWQLALRNCKVDKIFRNWAIFALGLFVVLGLQLALTKKIYGTAKFPSAGAVNFIEGKCEGDSQTDRNGSYRYSPLYSQIGRNRVRSWPFTFQESDQVWLAGWNCIKQNPYVLISSISSIYYLFHGNFHWPFSHTRFSELNAWYGMLFSFFVFPGILLGLLRLAKCPKRLFAFLPALSLFICVWFFKSEVRFRVPFDTIFIPLSALGWATTIKAFFPKNYKKILYISSYSYVLIVASAMSLSFLDYMIR